MKGARRLSVVIISLIFLFCVLIIQFYRLQILQQAYWNRLARAQHETIIVDPVKRGNFFSNTCIKQGHPEKVQPFVVDIMKFHLHVDSLSIPSIAKDEMGTKLHQFLPSIALEEIKSILQKKSRDRKIASWLSPEQVESIRRWWTPFSKKYKIPLNAIFFVKDYQRSYPFSHTLGQLLHTVREDRDPITAHNYPTGGLESYFDSYLKGEVSKKRVLRSSRNSIETGEILQTGSNGSDIYLTINHHLQAIAEEEIKKAVDIAEAKCGWTILMDPENGHILSIAQYPFYDPSQYRHYYNNPELQEYMQLKPVVEAFEIGSIIKPITVAIALLANEELQARGELPLFHPLEKIHVMPTYFPGRSRLVKDVRDHTYLNMYMALQKSSNVYVAKLVERIIDRLGAEWYREKLEKIFGFGKKTGIEYPYENVGFLPKPGKTYKTGSVQWSKATPYSLAMGYNLLANSMQMMRAYGILANRGIDVQPTFIRKIVNKDRIIMEPVPQKRRIISEEICEEIVKALKFGTKRGGTAFRADIPGYTEAGKTSTSEKIKNGKYSSEDHFSSCIGFVPANKPRFVLFVAIDEPKYTFVPGLGRIYFGGVCAAPAFKEIAVRALQYLGIPPDDPYGNSLDATNFDPSKADWAEEVKELAKLYQSWN